MEKSTKRSNQRSQRDYSLVFKLQVVQKVEEGELTYKRAQKHYGIQGKSMVLVWLRKNGILDWTLPKHILRTKIESLHRNNGSNN